MIAIENHIDYFSNVWIACSSDIKKFKNGYSETDQKTNERIFEKIIQDLKTIQKNNGSGLNNTHKNKASVTPIFRQLFTAVFGFEDQHLNLILSPQFKSATKDFLRMAREFDPQLDLNDIFQACRNAWIMNGIQLMFDMPVEVTPSIFAYSMLYPYSDNYLDDPDIPRNIKYEFNHRFHQRLAGQKIEPENTHEKQIFDLIGMIEGQFDRVQFPGVYKSLLAIHSAQAKSLKLVKPVNGMTGKDVMRLCIEKGGTSVLADGYLVAGNLTEWQERFFFGYGTYLQFIDDIQDVKEDTCAGQLTIFSQVVNSYSLDEFTNKTFEFGEHVMGLLNGFGGSTVQEFKRLINKSIDSMLVETILLNADYYSSSYIKEIQSHSPLSITYLKKRRSKMSPERISYIKKIVESMI